MMASSGLLAGLAKEFFFLSLSPSLALLTDAVTDSQEQQGLPHKLLPLVPLHPVPRAEGSRGSVCS